MQHIEPLTYGNYYHIYNCGINSCDLFHKQANFENFIGLYDKHISPVAETFAWVLMPNHFHLLVRIKDEVELISPDRVPNPVRAMDPSKQFSNLFNSYAQAFNKISDRHGNLFERPFKRKLIEDKEYLRTMVVYIHNNPVHHGFTQHAIDYQWSSYRTFISIKPTRLQRDKVIIWFNNLTDFISAHENRENEVDMEQWLGL